MRVRLISIHKYWETQAGKLRVLENVNVEFKSGDFIAIMGPSGSGKSTLLFLLGCIDLPNFGHIFLDETDVTAQSETVREKIRLNHIGFIFQNYYLIPTLSVMENVMLPMQLAGSYGSERDQRAASLLRLVGMEKKAFEKTTRLSGGQVQRVATARALANLPGLLLADEPTGNLDTRGSKEIMEVLRSVNENQKLTTIVVTHDPKVASYANRTYYLDEGRLTATAI
ncbi:MAG: ABC transporter ATP-binding protein [Candidatus Eremiobacteraeota bacterium]|nr:ABC transporter ATP-binding protein [Candidatus Eremiobacteraeota bacterium]